MAKETPPFNNPFASLPELVKLRERLPSGPSAAEDSTAERPPTRRQRARIRLERKGRRGKQVTLIEGLALSPEERAEWLEGLKAALGCGGTVEAETLVLQGDQRQRLPRLLEARGVTTTVG